MPSSNPLRDELPQLRAELKRIYQDLQHVGQRINRLEDLAAGEVPVAAPPPEAPTPPEFVSRIDVHPPIGADSRIFEAARREVPMLELADEPERHQQPTQGPRPHQPSTPPRPAWDLAVAVAQLRKNKSRKDDAGPKESLEAIIGGRWLTWIGAFALVIAVGFAIRSFNAPFWLRSLGFHLLGLGFLGVAHWLDRRRLLLVSQALAGLGLFTLYTVAYASLRVYHLWDETVAFAEGAVITGAAIAVGLRARSVGVILLGALGGYLTPILTSSGSGNHVALFSYLAFLNVSLIACAVWRQWSFLKPLVLLATAVMFALWIGSSTFENAREAKLWSTQAFAVLHAGILLLGTTIPPLVWRRRSTPFDLLALGASSLWLVGLTWYLFRDRPEQQMALVCWGMSLLHLVLFACTYARVSNVDRMPRVHLAMFAVFFTLAAPLQLNDDRLLGATWCIEGLVFMVVASYFRDRQMSATSLVVFALAACRLFGWDFFARGEPIAGTAIDFRFAMATLSGLVAMLAGGLCWLMPRVMRSEQPLTGFEVHAGNWLLALGNVTLLLAMTRQWDGRAVLFLWTLDAAIIWALGFRYDRPRVRWYALVLAVVFVGGRALYHFDHIDDSAIALFNVRFLSLALVAALYFAAGWMHYRRALARSSAAGLMLDEKHLHVVLGVLGNLVLIAAINWEVRAWFGGRDASHQPLDVRLLHSATNSLVWSAYATVLLALGFILRYRLLRVFGLSGSAFILLKVMGVDYFLFSGHRAAGAIDPRFVAITGSALVAMLAANLYWLAPRRFRPDKAASPVEFSAAAVLLGAANLVAMAGLTRQWDGRIVLALWTLDAAACWALGFFRTSAIIRWYAAAIGVFMAGGRAVYHFNDLDQSFALLMNARFGSLLLLAAVYLAAGWCYRRLHQPRDIGALQRPVDELELAERRLDPLLGILGNAVLVFAICFEIDSWYDQPGAGFGADVRMAEQATYSIVLAIYAAVVVAAGFLLRYPLFRILGLAAYVPIVAKVFLVDLASLGAMPRVLAFAVLGFMLLGVSFLYQKFIARILEGPDEPETSELS